MDLFSLIIHTLSSRWNINIPFILTKWALHHISHSEHIPRQRWNILAWLQNEKQQRKQTQKQPKRSLWLCWCHSQLLLYLLNPICNNSDTKSRLFLGKESSRGYITHAPKRTLIGTQQYEHFTVKWEPRAVPLARYHNSRIQYTRLISLSPPTPLVPLQLPPNSQCDSHRPASKSNLHKLWEIYESTVCLQGMCLQKSLSGFVLFLSSMHSKCCVTMFGKTSFCA